MKFIRKAGKWMVIIALVELTIGVYIAVEHPELVERISSCVTN